MEAKLSFCGMRCDLCLAYRPNVTTHPENRHLLSDGWHQYFGFRIPPEEILCEGCRQTQHQTLDQDCPVRPCVIDRNLEHCAECEDYICEKLKGRLVNFESLQQEYGQTIPQADRQRFIFPYENAHRLSALRKQ